MDEAGDNVWQISVLFVVGSGHRAVGSGVGSSNKSGLR